MTPPTASPETFDFLMQTKGWAHFRGVLRPNQVGSLSADLDRVYPPSMRAPRTAPIGGGAH